VLPVIVGMCVWTSLILNTSLMYIRVMSSS